MKNPVLGYFDPYRWDKYVVLKQWEQITQECDVISQKNRYISCTAAKTKCSCRFSVVLAYVVFTLSGTLLPLCKERLIQYLIHVPVYSLLHLCDFILCLIVCWNWSMLCIADFWFLSEIWGSYGSGHSGHVLVWSDTCKLVNKH